ncbi:MAG: TldD/PmbA family protein [Bdellovibrionaceae bacterium]|nr:TldD/PmbA family protein [Pseudobdellovibrionaceae bacterium]
MSACKNEVEYLGVKIVTEKTTQISVRNELSEGLSTQIDSGIRIEVMMNQHIGYASTSDTSDDGLQRAFKYAKAQTKFLSQHKAYPFSGAIRSTTQGVYRSQIQKPLDSLSLGEIQNVLRECTQKMNQAPAIFFRSASASIVETEETKLDSRGSEWSQYFSIVNLDLIVRAQDKNDIQTRSHNLCLQIGAEVFLRSLLFPLTEQITREVLELIHAPVCAKEVCDIIVSPDQMALQIHETVGHPLEIDRILGDERNYAGWSFVRMEDFGHLKYGTSKMNITFEPERFSELGSYSFDDSGLKGEKHYLIKDGLLVRGLGSLESSQRSQAAPVANFRSSSWNRPPTDRMANLNLESGTKPLKDIIASVENGIWMSTNRSWSIDDYRRKFQFGCEYGLRIQDGQIQGVVKNPNYHGVSVSFWNKLAEISNEAGVYGAYYCGKGEPNQLIRVGHASPYCLFKDIEVF